MRTPKKHEETPRGLSDISMKGVERLLKNNNNFSQSEEAGPSSSHYTSFPKATEFEWEDGFISTPGSREVVVQFYDDSSSTSKKKTIPRPTVQDKEVAEVVHKVHLLCLIARGRLIDNACDDSLIQAALLSLIPSYLLKRADEPKLTAKALTPLIKWFHDNFKVDCSGCPEKPFELSLASALENRKGSAEEVAALSVALFRALKLTTRFVSILDVASLKPITGTSGCSSEDLTRVDSGLFDSSTPMVTTPRKVSVSPLQSPSHKLSLKEKNSCGRGANEERLNTIASKECNDSSEACRTKSDGSKRKGDLEFELQLEMAAFATAYGLHDKSSSQMTDWSSSSTQLSSPSNIFKRIKTEKVPVVSQGISTAVGSRKRGAPLYWAEVFCGGENLTGKWVHVDAVNSIIGGEETVEAATSACKRTLRYVIAFAGNGAKDVTRRYCTKWYKIASQRINPHWWDAVLGPLRELESRATGGLVLMDDRPLFTSSEPEMVNPSSSSVNAVLNDSVNTCIQECSRFATRSSLEDMELQTRALTEPLPTNQQAYSNHHLYCIERWLSKYEMLRPKGPILGYCSGHPVYPRTCVQILQTKQRWLAEGLQIKANESPAKVMKRSVKLRKGENSELGVSEEDEARGSFALYGKWQTEPLDLPRATNGRVPKNERGQVDVWSEKCLPLGTVHLRLPRVVPVAKRLEIDFAPAMVGFEFRNGRSVPVYEGIVVCSEFNDAIIQAYAEEEEKREAEEKRRDEAQAISRWYQLLSSVITRQRLRDAYGDDSTSEIPHHLNRKESACGMQVTNCEGNNPEGPRGHAFKSESTAVTKDHEHIFPVEDQTFDEESSVRTKRCPCGFLVQVEEL